MTIAQLARYNLALVMNNRAINKETTALIFGSILQKKIEDANSSDTFMLCMAVGRGLGRKFQVDDIPRLGNLVYLLYTKVTEHMP